MTTLLDKKTAYAQLVALTQLFLFRENSYNESFTTTPSVYNFFRPFVPVAKKFVTQHLTQPSPPFHNPPPMPTPKPAPEPGPIKPEPPPQPTQPEPLPPAIKDRERLKNDKEVVSKAPSSGLFIRETLATSPLVDFQELRSYFTKFFPQLTLLETIATDQEAQKVKNRWQIEQQIPPIIILSFNDQNDSLSFLKNVANAISLRLAPARVFSALKIEQENGWDLLLKSPQLRLIIAGDYGLYTLPHLMKYYKTESRQAKHYVDTIPLLLLSDPSIYLKDPQLKSLLWRAICAELKGPLSSL